MEFRILTYNVYLRPPPIPLWGDYKDQRLVKIIKDVIPQFDFCGIQEMFMSSRLSRLVSCAAKLGFHQQQGGKQSLLSFKFIDGGLITLSKWPIIDYKILVFKAGYGADYLSAKGAVYTMLQKEKTIHFFNTHLQASYGSKLEPYAACRKKQLEEIIEFVCDCMRDKPDGPIFLCGDFNVEFKTPEYNSLIELFEKKFKVTNLSLDDVTHNDWNLLNSKKEQVGQKLDYIFLLETQNPRQFDVVLQETLGFKVQNEPYCQLSDHCGVSITIKFH